MTLQGRLTAGVSGGARRFTGRLTEVGFLWVWPFALKAAKVLGGVGLFVAVSEAAGWISASLTGPGQAGETGDAIPSGTRTYYLGVLNSWGSYAEAALPADRWAFVGPVLVRARQVIEDPQVDHATIVTAIRSFAKFVETQIKAAGGAVVEVQPAEEPDEPGTLVVEETVYIDLPKEPAGAGKLPTPGAPRLAQVMPGINWLVALGLVGGGAAFLWWSDRRGR